MAMKMRPSASFSPRAKKQIARLAKKEKMITLPQMDTIVRHSCMVPPPSRLRLLSTLPTTRSLDLLTDSDIWEFSEFSPTFRILPSSPTRCDGDPLDLESLLRPLLQEANHRERCLGKRILQRIEDEEKLERAREEKQRRADQERRRNLLSERHWQEKQAALEKEADDLELQRALKQIEEQDQELVAEQKELCAAAKRMKERLALYGLKEIIIEGNGNCQFAAAAHFLGSKPNQVREKAVKWLRDNPDFTLDAKGSIRLRDFLNTDEYASWEDYCKHMARDGIWGDHLTLIAIANAFDRHVFVVSSLPDSSGVTCIESKAPNSRADSKRAVLLSHWHELHYNALTRDEKLFC